MDKKNVFKSIGLPGGILLLAGLTSCVNEAYDVENLNTEVTIAESGLTIPVGSTKQLKVKDLVKDLGDDVLTQLDGGYAIRLAETMSLADNLPDLNEMLKIDDISIDESFSFDIDGISSEDLTLKGQSFGESFRLGSEIKTDVSVPQFSANQTIALGLYEYARKIKDIKLGDGIPDTKIVEKFSIDLPTVPAGLPGSFDVPSQTFNINGISQNIEIGFESPDDKLTNICDIQLEESSKLSIKVQVTGHEFMTEGEVVPDLSVDLGSLFKLKNSDGSATAIPVKLDDLLNSDNNFKVEKTYRISAIDIKKENWNGGSFSQTSPVKVNGEIKTRNVKTTAAALNGYKGDGLVITIEVAVDGIAVKSATMDINGINVKEAVEVPVSLGDGISLPEQVQSIDNVYFTDNSLLVLLLGMNNVNDPNLKVNVNTLKMTFPARLSVEGSNNGSFTFSGFDLTKGFNHTFKLTGISLPAPAGGVIRWDDKVTVTADVTVNGTGVNSANFPATAEKDCAISTKATSSLTVKDWDATIKSFEVELPDVNQEFTQDVDESLADYGTFTIHPSGTPKLTLKIGMPQTSLAITPADAGLAITFPEFIKFKNVSSAYNFDHATNTMTLKGNIPESITMDIDRLVITPQKKESSKGYEIKGAFSVKGNVKVAGGSVTSKDLDNLNDSNIQVDASIPDLKAETLELDEFKIEINEAFLATLIKASELPEEIAGVSKAILDNVSADFKIKLAGLPDVGEGKDINVELKISLPQELVLEQDSRVEGNILTINGTVDKKDGSIAIAPIKVKEIDLSGYDFSSKEDLVEELTVSGKFSVKEPDIDLSSLKGKVEASVSAGIKNIAFSKVVGNIAYSLDESSETISLSDIPDILKDENITLDFDNPYIVLKARTNIGIPVDGSISLVPVRNGAEDPDGKIDMELNVEGSESASDTTDIMYYIAARRDGCPSDYKFIETPNIKKLLSRIPDELKVNFSARTNSNKPSIVEPSADYIFDVDYEFVCPLAFGEDLNIQISDTIKGLDDIISKILKDNKIQLGGEITNSLPLQLELNLDLLDENEKVIPLKTPAAQVINACASSGEASVTPLDLILETSASAGNISSIMLTFNVTSGNVTGRAVTEDDYVQASLKLHLPEGLTLDINDLK